MIALAPKHSEAIQILASLPKKEVSDVRLAYNGEVVAIVDESTIRALQVAIHDGLTDYRRWLILEDYDDDENGHHTNFLHFREDGRISDEFKTDFFRFLDDLAYKIF